MKEELPYKEMFLGYSNLKNSKLQYPKKPEDINNAFGKNSLEKNEKIIEDLSVIVNKNKEVIINKNEEIIINIEELADELSEEELKNKDNALNYKQLLEKYKKLILKHERRKKE